MRKREREGKNGDMGRKFKIQVTTMDSKKKKSLKWVGLVFNAHPAQLSLELGEEGRKRVGREEHLSSYSKGAVQSYKTLFATKGRQTNQPQKVIYIIRSHAVT